MSFGRSGRRGGRFGGRGGGRFGNTGPPEYVVELGTFEHPCEGEAVCKLVSEKIPYFNAPIFQENKVQVGRVDEIFGLIKAPLFTVKLNEGLVATSYAVGHKFYTDPNKLLSLERFLPSAQKRQPSTPGRGRGRAGRGRRGGFGGRGGGRGRFTPRGRGRRF